MPLSTFTKPVVARRGNALLMTLIALAVLMLVVAAAIQFTGTNREAAASKARADELQACATVGRKVLLSKLRTFGVSPTALSLNTKLPDNNSLTNDTQIRTAHVGATAPEPVIVKLESSVFGGSKDQIREMANVLGDNTLGGSYYRVVVSCLNPSSGASSEVEFTFRHGI